MITTRVWVRQRGDGISVSNREPIFAATLGWSEVWAKWITANYSVIEEIDEVTQVAVSEELPGKTVTDDDLMELEIWKRLLKRASWFDVERKDGKVEAEQYKAFISTLDPRVAVGLVYPVKEELFLSQKEREEIYKQCVSLFGSGGGVAFPNKYIKRFCEYQLFWEKFGMTKEDLRRLPQKEFLRLKNIAYIEIERRKYEMEAAKYAAKKQPPQQSRRR